MTILADLADALGISQRAVREQFGASDAADAVLALLVARIWPHTSSDRVIKTAGIDVAEVKRALKREDDRRHREYQDRARLRAETASVPSAPPVPRRRHEPDSPRPSPNHYWCRRGDHWVHELAMTRNSHRPNGLGEWCKWCFREYWNTVVVPRREAAKRAAAERRRADEAAAIAVEKSEPAS